MWPSFVGLIDVTSGTDHGSRPRGRSPARHWVLLLDPVLTGDIADVPVTPAQPGSADTRVKRDIEATASIRERGASSGGAGPIACRVRADRVGLKGPARQPRPAGPYPR